MMRRFALYGLALALALAGCGGDGKGKKSSSTTGGGEDVTGGGSKTDVGQRPEHPQSKPGECNCWPDEICQPETGECVATQELPEGQLYGEVELNHVFYPEWNDEPFGMASAQFFVYETPPRLQEYYTDDGEICVVHDYSSSGQQWPQGPLLDAGNVTVEVDSAPGPIVLEPMDVQPYGFVYDIQYGLLPTVNNVGNHFSADYVPLGRSFTVEGAGGADVDAFSFDAGQMPDEFTVDGGEEYDGGIEVRWSPAQPGAKMEIVEAGGMEAELVCTVKDDGVARVPFGWSQVNLRRVTERLATVDAGGKELQLLVRARHIWGGDVTIAGKSSGSGR